MADTYTTLIRLIKQTDGENSNTWGQKEVLNHTLTEESIAGMETIAVTGGTNTLSASNGSSDEARNMILKFTGVLTSNETVVVPTSSKVYVVWNATTGDYTLTVKTSGGSGIVVKQGAVDFLFCDGVDIKKSIAKGEDQTQFISLGLKGTHTTGDNKDRVIIPAALNGKDIVGAYVVTSTAGTTGLLTIQINNSRAGDVFSTKITIDSGETSSATALTPHVINTSTDDLQTGDILRLDVDVVQTTPGEDISVVLEVR
jgi:hypothetical protein